MRRQLADHGIFLLRVTVSLLMLTHGIPKLLEYKTLIHTFPDPLNVGTQVSAQLMIFAEVGCSVLLLLGLLGRFASLTLFIAMMVAAFVHHFADPWSSRELPLLYASVYACLTLTGPGSSSIDAWVNKKVFEKPEPALPKPRTDVSESRR
ncbi:MAG: DoxX family protein [Myxococcales bacterium]|jgi:putative oxidoreductase